MVDQPRALILDNGGGFLKAGLAQAASPISFPNAIMKSKRGRNFIIGSQINNCIDVAGLSYRRACEKGYAVNMDVQRTVWNHTFKQIAPDDDFSATSLVVTEPPFNFPSIQETMDEMVFEDFGFASYFRAPTYRFAAFGMQSAEQPCTAVVETGFSFTHVVPLVLTSSSILPRAVRSAIRRIDVGGKVLTNFLLELVSYRALDLSDEFCVVERMKEDVCFVAPRCATALKSPTLALEYILPDFGAVLKGHVRAPDEIVRTQAVRLATERCWVPETLFAPSAVGIHQMGISDCVSESLSSTHTDLRTLFFSNVVLCGGSARMPGLADRLRADLRRAAPADIPSVNVTLPSDPAAHVWQGAAAFSRAPQFAKSCVTKADYEEHGPSVCAKFTSA
eukprot:m.33786 g.33786  ORF g.33786 m.33786 type:complete len:392 (+) comp9491_c0_seq2:1002-2177(+)